LNKIGKIGSTIFKPHSRKEATARLPCIPFEMFWKGRGIKFGDGGTIFLPSHVKLKATSLLGPFFLDNSRGAK